MTSDAVVLDLRPARVPTRLLATAIDLVLLFGANYLYGYIVQQLGIGGSSRADAVSLAGYILITLGYPITMETLTRGRTVGAFALGLRVVRDDGGAIRFRQALLRGLAFWMVDFAIWTGFCAGVICAAVNRDSKRFGDLMAGTLVIRTRPPKAPAPLPPVPAELAGWASTLELSGLSDELVTAARQLLQRSNGLMKYPGERLAYDLAHQVATQTAPPPPTQLPPLEFLAAVVAERRSRETSRISGGQWVPAAEELPTGWR